MIEFMIRPTDDEWFDLRPEVLDALHPSSFPWSRVEGRGNLRLSVNGCEVAISDEDPGIQVTFECDGFSYDEAKRLVEEVAASLTAATGQGARVVELGG